MSWLGEVIRDRYPDAFNVHNKAWVKLTKNNLGGKLAHWARGSYVKLTEGTRKLGNRIGEARFRFVRVNQREAVLHKALIKGQMKSVSGSGLEKLISSGDASKGRELAERLLAALDGEQLHNLVSELKAGSEARLSNEENSHAERMQAIRQKTAIRNRKIMAADASFAEGNTNWVQDLRIHNLLYGVPKVTPGVVDYFLEAHDKHVGRDSTQVRMDDLRRAMETVKRDLEKHAEALDVKLQERIRKAESGEEAISYQHISELNTAGVLEAIDYLDTCLKEEDEMATFMEAYRQTLHLPTSIRHQPHGSRKSDYLGRVRSVQQTGDYEMKPPQVSGETQSVSGSRYAERNQRIMETSFNEAQATPARGGPMKLSERSKQLQEPSDPLSGPQKTSYRDRYRSNKSQTARGAGDKND